MKILMILLTLFSNYSFCEGKDIFSQKDNLSIEKAEIKQEIEQNQGSRYLVKDFGTSKSPKSTRQRAKYFGRDCPASGTLR